MRFIDHLEFRYLQSDQSYKSDLYDSIRVNFDISKGGKYLWSIGELNDVLVKHEDGRAAGFFDNNYDQLYNHSMRLSAMLFRQ